jgi:hypothetical protein
MRFRDKGKQTDEEKAMASLNQLKVRKKRLRFERSLIHEWGLFTQVRPELLQPCMIDCYSFVHHHSFVDHHLLIIIHSFLIILRQSVSGGSPARRAAAVLYTGARPRRADGKTHYNNA